MNQGLARLTDFARKHGGDIVRVDYFPDGAQECPFSIRLAIDYEAKTLYYDDDDLCFDELGNMIHELGHIFASKKPPETSDEYSFFGWEYAVAQETDLLAEWLDSTRHYTLSEDGDEFQDLSNGEQSDCIEERSYIAVKLGLVSPEGLPICIR